MGFCLGAFSASIVCKANTHMSNNHNSNNKNNSHALDASFIKLAAEIADKSAGFTSPHPNFGCMIATATENVVGEGYLYAQGTRPAEVQAVEVAGDWCKRATAYMNMEPGDCHGDRTAVSSLIKAGINRVVVGIRHPLQHLRGNAIRALRSEGLKVEVLGEDLQDKVFEIAYPRKL